MSRDFPERIVLSNVSEGLPGVTAVTFQASAFGVLEWYA